MKLKEYIQVLTKMAELDPSLLDCEVIYEDNDNKLKRIESSPIIGYYSGNNFHAMSPVPFVEKLTNNAVKLA